MEPFIGDYYNDTPNCVNVIDKMNEELSEVQNENELLKKRLAILENINNCPKPTITIIKGEDIEKYESLNDDIEKELKEILNQSKVQDDDEHSLDMEDIFLSSNKLVKILKKYLVNETEEWCKYRIDSALNKYESLRYLNSYWWERIIKDDVLCDKIIDMIVESIMGDEYEPRISELYVVQCNKCNGYNSYDDIRYDKDDNTTICFNCSEEMFDDY